MIIISQDRTEIINFDNTLNIALYEDDDDRGWQIYAGMKAPDDNYRILGYYVTKERAKEVLMEITDEFTSYMSLENVVGGIQSVHAIPNAYSMPEK